MSRARDIVLELEGIARSLSYVTKLSGLGPATLRALEGQIDFERCALVLLPHEDKTPRIAHARGISPVHWAKLDSALSNGSLGEIMESGTTTIMPPVQLDPEQLEALGAADCRSLVIQPCIVDGRVVGQLMLCAQRADAFDELDLATSSYVAKLVGVSWDRLRQDHELQKRNAILSALTRVTDRLLQDDTWQGAVDEILERLGSVTRASRAYVFENHRDRAGTLLVSQRFEWAAQGTEPQLDNPELQGLPLVAAGFTRWASSLTKGQAIMGLVREFPASEQEILAQQGILSILVVPIMTKDRWWGFLGFDDCEREREWTRMETDTLQTAANALGSAILAARTRRRLERAERRASSTAAKLERALEGTVGVLLTIMQTRDQRLANHQQRVAELALAMAQLMGLSRDAQKGTWLAALLHDLGKLSLPFWLVAAGEPQDAAARSRFRAHVRLGQQMLAPLDLPWPIAEIVGQHHERPDGRGYPLGLESPNIRDEALIIRVADYVETRVTRLEYGDGNSLERVLERLEGGAGTRFDRDAVEACVSLFRGSGFFFTTPPQPLDDSESLDNTSSVPSSTSS
jgi:putative nucleotidyltransferase with HDIG domain